MEHISAGADMKIFPNKQNQKLIVSFVVGVGVGIFSSWMWVATGDALAPNPESEDVAATPKVTEEDVPVSQIDFSGSEINNSAIVVHNQNAGLSVSVSKAELPEDGWVVIHEGTASQIGNALGAARFDRGAHGGVVELLRATEPGILYRAVLYRDNGDREFDLDSDFPFIGDGNQPILSTFTVQ